MSVFVAGFDGSGNLSFGFSPTEMALFPEVEFNYDVSSRVVLVVEETRKTLLTPLSRCSLKRSVPLLRIPSLAGVH